ncbi:MAG: HEAT repeat domain-containing protein [Candidatus Thalassarchaeum sp.]
MAGRYVARDPRTWKKIGSSTVSVDVNIQGLLPTEGAWERIPKHEVIPLARGDVASVQLPRGKGGSFAVRADGIKALHKVLESRLDEAHDVMLECLDDDDAAIRVAALRGLPPLAIKRHEGLLQCLSDRLMDEHPDVLKAARDCLTLVAPVFPSGCEQILRRELRRNEDNHRKNAFEALRLTAESWPEVGCLHLDELIREDDRDLRRRGSRILRKIATRSGSAGWDLVGWSLEDEDPQVRKNASGTLVQLANAEPAIATILIEAAMQDEDPGVRKSVIRALKRLDMRNPRVSKMIIDGARSRDYKLRKACIDHLPVVMTGEDLRNAAAELLRQETRSALRRQLASLARDVEIDGTEDEKNRFLAPLDKVEREEVDEPPRSGESSARREHDKQKSGRPHSED